MALYGPSDQKGSQSVIHYTFSSFFLALSQVKSLFSQQSAWGNVAQLQGGLKSSGEAPRVGPWQIRIPRLDGLLV